MENQTKSFLTLTEAATELGCTRRFLETRIEDGEIAVFKPSARLIRIKRAELDRWIESYTKKACVFAGETTGKVH